MKILGMTCIELLIVISIILSFLVILVPVISNELEKSRQMTDLSNLYSAYQEAKLSLLHSNFNYGYAIFGPIQQTNADSWGLIAKEIMAIDEISDFNLPQVAVGDMVTIYVYQDNTIIFEVSQNNEYN